MPLSTTSNLHAEALLASQDDTVYELLEPATRVALIQATRTTRYKMCLIFSAEYRTTHLSYVLGLLSVVASLTSRLSTSEWQTQPPGDRPRKSRNYLEYKNFISNLSIGFSFDYSLRIQILGTNASGPHSLCDC